MLPLAMFIAWPSLAGCAGGLDPAIEGLPSAGTGAGTPSGSGGASGAGSGSGGATSTGGVTGSGGANPGSGGGAGPCDVQTQVFDAYGCSASICHGAAVAPDLTGSGSDVASMLKGMKADAACMSSTYINTSAPTSSALVKAVSGTTCGGTQMPVGGLAVTQADIDCLVDWMSKIQ
jgi:hypothetical protein